MEFIKGIINQNAGYKLLLADIENNRLPIALNGLSHIHKAVILAALSMDSEKKGVIITPDEATASSLLSDLASMKIDAVSFPARDFCFGETLSHSKEYEHIRIDTLSKLLDGAFRLLVISAEAAIQYTMPKDFLRQNTFSIKTGEEITLNALKTRLLASGYTLVPLTEGRGQFSVRGGIVDIFPANMQSPVRIEFWGDEIDTISLFDAESQRRGENINDVKIIPANEIAPDTKTLSEKLQKLLQKDRKLNDKNKSRIENDIALIDSGIDISYDRYLAAIYEPFTAIDYIENPLVFVYDSNGIASALKGIFARQKEDTAFYLEEGFLCHKFSKYTKTAAEFKLWLERAVFMENFSRAKYDLPLKEVINFNLKRLPVWNGDVAVLLDDIGYTLSNEGSCAVLSGEEKNARILCDTLNSKGINATLCLDGKHINKKGVTVLCGGLSSGFELPEQNFMLITQNFISGERVRKRRFKAENAIGSLDELKSGDYVVHAQHGIGIFAGINKITNDGVTKDYIKINYAKTDVLYVPVTQLDLISKYIGSAENSNIKLNRLGSGDWQKTRARVKRAVKDMAKELTALYAKRMSVKGYAFSADTPLQQEFEAKFPFVETDDQIRSANEIKRDMERAVPMDRLLCGDVGFGKTEVALRAAFKCISEGKQCVFLVPTTILAWQHFNTALRRFGDMPLTVKMLSRFVSPAAKRKTISELKLGKVDMVIGTHRLISKDISFKNLGLVIIDEEQRFGVAQKEKLKQDYPEVDVLTLSATPIPRTLNMAMSGLRDMSTIDEAPSDRLPVQTYVLEQNDGIIIDAIRKELRRAGQVYYLHNRVDDIVSKAARLKEKIPEARIAVAHGKMSEEELSEVWQRLLEHEIDILVCTTIIETGVDVPNANTLIVENADRMGLSQLHQLRGRVGRSPRRAFAYFCFKANRQINEVAERRLEAIREFTEFGAGFKIAMRDLEIRGAGSILGGEQHGNLEAVGYDMYIKLLNEAINEEKGLQTAADLDCTIDINISAYIPERYIESLPARLGIYKRIAAISSDAQRMDVIDELCDRFSEPPKEVLGLIDIALLRNRAARLGIYAIEEDKNGIILRVNAVTPEQLERLNEPLGNRLCLYPSEPPYYSVKYKSGQKKNQLINEIASIL